MNNTTEELLIITLAIVILVATYVTIDPSITGFTIYHPSCLDNYTLIQAYNQDIPITQLPENTHIYITYRNNTWPDWVTITEKFTPENNFSICVNTISDQIKIKSCGKDECSNYAYIQKELGDDILAIEKAEFIIITIDLNDQYSTIDEAHQFYDNAFMNIYNTNNKLIFGCGNCHSTNGELKNNYQFIIPKQSNYDYQSLVKTTVTTYNDIEGNTVNVESASENSISTTFRNVNITFYDQNEEINHQDLFVDIIKPSNNRILWEELQTNSNYLIPSNIEYKTQEITDPEGSYNDIRSSYNAIESTEQIQLSPTFRKVIVNTFNENCTEINETGYIIRPSNDNTIYTLQNNDYFYSPIETEIKYKIENGDLQGPIIINNSVTNLKISSNGNCSGLLYEENIPCQEEWICNNWTECINETQTRICTDINECGTQENKPSEQQDCEQEEPPQETPPPSSPSSGKPSVTRYKSSTTTQTVQESPKSTTETKSVSQTIELKSAPEPQPIIETKKSNMKIIGNVIGISYLAFLCLLLYKRRHKL